MSFLLRVSYDRTVAGRRPYTAHSWCCFFSFSYASLHYNVHTREEIKNDAKCSSSHLHKHTFTFNPFLRIEQVERTTNQPTVGSISWPSLSWVFAHGIVAARERLHAESSYQHENISFFYILDCSPFSYSTQRNVGVRVRVYLCVRACVCIFLVRFNLFGCQFDGSHTLCQRQTTCFLFPLHFTVPLLFGRLVCPCLRYRDFISSNYKWYFFAGC